MLEVRREDNTRYHPKTIYQLLSGLLRHSRDVQFMPANFLDRGDTHFKPLHNTCDSEFRSLHEDGIGTERKSVNIITKKDEDRLWSSAVLNTKNTRWVAESCVLLPRKGLLSSRRRAA